jgi:hypothetical protein
VYTFGTLHTTFSQENRTFGGIPMSYTTKLKNNMDQLIKVIGEAGLPTPIYWDFENGKGKNEFISIEVLPSDLIERLSGAVVRTYPFQINYYMTLVGDKKLKIMDALSRRIDKLERTLNNNSNRTVSGTYYWHDGDVTEMNLDAPLEDFEDLSNLHVGRLTFIVTTTETL